MIDPADLVERAQAEGGADVVLELVGAPNLDPDLQALAIKGRIVIVGTGAGAEAPLDLRKLMGRRARVHGHRPARPSAGGEGGAPCARSPARSSRISRPVAIAPLVDRVFPAAEAAAAFDRLQEPGKLGKVLLDFGSPATG